MEKNEIVSEDCGIILRTAMSSIPGLSSLATWWNEFETSKNTKRLELFINSLNAITHLHSEELDSIKNDVTNNADRIAILEVTIDKVIKEWEDEKIKLHASLAVHNIISSDPLQHKMMILEKFSELSLSDLGILERLSTSTSVQVCEIGGSLEILISILSKLESRGLITETGHGNRGMWSSAATDRWQDKWTHKFYTATPIGISLLNAIK